MKNILLNKYRLQNSNDICQIKQILLENKKWDAESSFSRKKEFRHFWHFTKLMLGAFPIGLATRKIIRCNKKLNYILKLPELQNIRSNIEKGSFAYDTILFKQNVFQIMQNKSHLANLVCLALLFGDEFIDGIAMSWGKSNIQKILTNPQYNFTLQYEKKGDYYSVYYPFDISTILPEEVLNKMNNKYTIDYKTFYDHLLFLLEEINCQLKKLPHHIARDAAYLICKVCNKCFDTYKTEIQECLQEYEWKKIIVYHQNKDDEIIKIMLTLRGTLLGKNTPGFQQQYSSWAIMVRSMQIYDDMQDAAIDMNYQMNYLVFFAKSFFKQEWEWLQNSQEDLKHINILKIQQQIAIHMPASMQLCMQYNKNICYKSLNWVQQKIQNHLWRKNWLGINNSLYQSDENIINLNTISSRILQYKSALFTMEMKYAQILDIILLHKKESSKLMTLLSQNEKYFLKNCYITYATYKKASLAKRFLTLV